MMEDAQFGADEASELMQAVSWVANVGIEHYAHAHPRAVKWTDIWAELRQSYGPNFEHDAQHRTALVICHRNQRTQKTQEREVFVGTGDCPICTMLDLLTQMRAEVPQAFADSDSVRVKTKRTRTHNIRKDEMPSNAFPLGLFGPFARGVA